MPFNVLGNHNTMILDKMSPVASLTGDKSVTSMASMGN